MLVIFHSVKAVWVFLFFITRSIIMQENLENRLKTAEIDTLESRKNFYISLVESGSGGK